MNNMLPNVLFITIDSLRADRFFGQNRSCKTPNIDSLVERGLYCKNAVSSSDATGITLGNFFTGKYSFKTGITLRNFNSKEKTLFDILKNYGYSLHGLIPKLTWFDYLTHKFDDKDEFFCANLTQDDLTTKLGQKILDKLKSKKMSEPWFYYLQLEDLHDKIILPDDFNDELFGSTNYDQMVSCVDTWLGKILKEIDLSSTLLVITGDHGEYIHPVDSNIGKIPNIQKLFRQGKKYFPFLEPLGLKIFILLRDLVKYYEIRKLKKTLSDEELRSLTSRRAAKTLHDETNRIPILFVGKNVKTSIMIDNLVGSVDVFPTILSILGLKYDNSNLDGRNLSVVFDNQKIIDKPLYIESSDSDEFQSGFVIGIRTLEYKYVRSKQDPKKHASLYNIQVDPHENHNLIGERTDIVEQMETHLTKITDYQKNNESDISSADEEKIRDELKKMGYV